MLIKGIFLENFLSVKSPTTLEIAPITLLYGPNSSGKSVIPDALIYLRKLLSGDTHSFDKYSHLSSSEPVSVGISVEVTLDHIYNALHSPSMDPYEEAEYEEIGLLHHYIQQNNSKSVVMDITFCGQGENQQIEVSLAGQLAWSCHLGMTKINLHNPVIEKLWEFYETQIGGIGSANCVRVLYEGTEVPVSDGKFEWTSCGWKVDISPKAGFQKKIYPFNTRYDDDYNDIGGKETYKLFELITAFFMCGSIRCLETHLTQCVAFVGPIRKIFSDAELTFRFSEREKNKHKYYFAHADNAPPEWNTGCAAWYTLARGFLEAGNVQSSNMVLREVNAWLSADQKMELGYEIVGARSKTLFDEFVPIDVQDHMASLHAGVWVSLACRSTETGMIHNLEDIGVGISQVVPVLVAGKSKELVCVEQPELHLHPRAQAALGDYVSSTWLNDKTQWIAETHSELLALRLLRRLRTSVNSDISHRDFAITPDDLAFFYFRKQGAETEVIPLRVGEDGEFLDRWPDGFFAEQEKELFADD